LVKGIEGVAKSYGLLNHCGGNWDNLLDKRIVEDTFKHRKKYNTNSVCDLIRVFLN